MQLAVAQAEAGAHVVSPSGMMDGQVEVIRQALDDRPHRRRHSGLLGQICLGFLRTIQEAVDSALTGDRKTYQMDSANRTEAILETELDIQKLPIWSWSNPPCPTWISCATSPTCPRYRLPPTKSQGMRMIEAAAANGWIEREPACQVLTAIRRAEPKTF